MRLAPIVAFVHMAVCGYLRVDIKSFTLEVVTNPAWLRQRAESGAPVVQFREEQQLFEDTTTFEQPTDSCRFRFPQQKHVDGILSDMMNQLARIYVKIDEFLSRQQSKPARSQRAARALATRYKLARDRRKSFFEDLFNNMTSEFSRSFNASEWQPSAGVCPPQLEARRRWRALLQLAGGRLARAVRWCAARQLAARGVAPQSRAARRLRRHVARELRLLAPRQLRALCDTFRLCYQDEFLQSDAEVYKRL